MLLKTLQTIFTAHLNKPPRKFSSGKSIAYLLSPCLILQNYPLNFEQTSPSQRIGRFKDQPALSNNFCLFSFSLSDLRRGKSRSRNERDRAAQTRIFARRNDPNRCRSKVSGQSSFRNRVTHLRLDQIPSLGNFSAEINLRRINRVNYRSQSES